VCCVAELLVPAAPDDPDGAFTAGLGRGKGTRFNGTTASNAASEVVVVAVENFGVSVVLVERSEWNAGEVARALGVTAPTVAHITRISVTIIAIL